jgi:DNA-binding response OmpR family regulator
MIAIVCSNARERAALAALCEGPGWPYREFDSVRKAARSFPDLRPKVVLTRYKLSDGYSDDVFGLVTQSGLNGTARVIVLVGAGASSALESRQVSLGADVVYRDPVRADVLVAYLARFRNLSGKLSDSGSERPVALLEFAGAKINAIDRTLHHAGKSVPLAPKEVELVQILLELRGRVVTYDVLYSEIIGRRFQGETSNMRVLLGKLGRSFRKVGLDLRPWIEVIPKTGYRYKSS